MYSNPIVQGAPVAGGVTLASTGFDSLWMVVAGLSLVALGGAMKRLAPRRSTESR